MSQCMHVLKGPEVGEGQRVVLHAPDSPSKSTSPASLSLQPPILQQGITQLAALQAAPAGWVLKKERAHKGQGVHILAPREALQAASERTRLGRAVYPVAQRLLSDQLLVDGRPLILRCDLCCSGDEMGFVLRTCARPLLTHRLPGWLAG